MLSLLSTILSAAALFQLSTAQAPTEPPDGRVLFGVWLNTSANGLDTDSPANFNRRMGFLASSQQFTQRIPLMPYNWVTGAGGQMNYTHIDLSESTASVYLTVYPSGPMEVIKEEDVVALARQLASYSEPPYNRDVFLRFAPEMNGNWMAYSFEPTAFVETWRALHRVIKQTAPKVNMVWAPNGAIGYPYTMTLDNFPVAADKIAVDTNGDGVLNAQDDAYSPWYPGDEYVDWVGVSYYWKGSTWNYAVLQNDAPYPGMADGWMHGRSPPGISRPLHTEFYNTYCSGKNKPCMLAETGASFYPFASASQTRATQLQIQEGWWEDILANRTFWDTYPKLKMYMHFEYEKMEDDGYIRDFRISANTQVREGLLNALSSSGMMEKFMFAEPAAAQIRLSAAASATEAAPYTPPAQPTTTLPPNIFHSQNNKNRNGNGNGGAGMSVSLVAVGVAMVVYIL